MNPVNKVRDGSGLIDKITGFGLVVDLGLVPSSGIRHMKRLEKSLGRRFNIRKYREACALEVIRLGTYAMNAYLLYEALN